MDSILIALELMGYGLAGTFLSLILLFFVILLVRRLFKFKNEVSTDE
jgi:hypothetical protein